MELLRFIFQDFYHWLGAFLLLWVPFEGVAKIIRAHKGTDKEDEGGAK